MARLDLVRTVASTTGRRPRRSIVRRQPRREPARTASTRWWKPSARLLVWVGVFAALAVADAADALWAVATWDLGAVGAPAAQPSTDFYASGEEDPVAAAGVRLRTWLFLAGAGAIAWPVSPHVVLAFWAARRRIVEQPAAHRRLLGWTAGVGIAVGWLGGLPAALAHVGLLAAPPAAVAEDGAFGVLHALTGTAGGVGYVAVFALVAERLSRRGRRGPVVVAVTAVGKRSLSCYLAHSAIFAPVLAAWGLGWGAWFGSAGMVGFAVVVWSVTAVAAYAMEGAGRVGPAEALLRRLVYGRRPAGAVRDRNFT